MSRVDLAVAFVFVCNVVFLLAGALVLHRLIRQSEDGQVVLVAAAQRSEAASKHLRDAALRVSESTGKGGFDSRAVSSVVSDVERLQGQAHDLVGRLSALLAGGRVAPTANPDAPGEAAFQELTAQNRALRDRLERLRGQMADALDDAAVRRQTLPDGADHPDQLMQAQLIDQLTQCIETLRAQLEDQSPRALEAELPPGADQDHPDSRGEHGDQDDLRAALTVAEEEIGVLRHEVDGLRDLIGRTIREKDFIEDRFLTLDRTLVEGVRAAEPV